MVLLWETHLEWAAHDRGNAHSPVSRSPSSARSLGQSTQNAASISGTSHRTPRAKLQARTLRTPISVGVCGCRALQAQWNQRSKACTARSHRANDK